MEKLLSTFSITDILLFIVLLAVAIKGVVSWIEWAQGKIKEKVNKTNQHDELKQEIIKIKESQDEIVKSIQKTNEEIHILKDNINLLTDSDRDDIKAWITQQHHYFCYKLGYIDDYNLDVIERRFKHYKDEGGNSFIEDFMLEIRALPKKSNADFRNIQMNSRE